MSRYSEYFTNLKVKYFKVTGGATGDILYHDGTTFVLLNAGASGDVLTVDANGKPSWVTPAG